MNFYNIYSEQIANIYQNITCWVFWLRNTVEIYPTLCLCAIVWNNVCIGIFVATSFVRTKDYKLNGGPYRLIIAKDLVNLYEGILCPLFKDMTSEKTKCWEYCRVCYHNCKVMVTVIMTVICKVHAYMNRISLTVYSRTGNSRCLLRGDSRAWGEHWEVDLLSMSPFTSC